MVSERVAINRLSVPGTCTRIHTRRFSPQVSENYDVDGPIGMDLCDGDEPRLLRKAVCLYDN